MTEEQKDRLSIYREFGDNVQKAYNFVFGTTQCSNDSHSIKDGVYIIYKDGSYELFNGENKKDCVAVGIKLGGKSIAVSLKDAADGENITLTNSKDETEYDGYINNHKDAVADWNGKDNTKHLEEIGLNKDIKLKTGQYIPAAGEMYLIHLHTKALNEALEAAGGEPIADDWYWTSTEYSATDAWFLCLLDGTMYHRTKATNAKHVRPVSAFPL